MNKNRSKAKKEMTSGKPNLLRSEEEIRQSCMKIQKAIDAVQKEKKSAKPSPFGLRPVLTERIDYLQGALRALSWVLNQEGASEIVST